MQEYKQEEGQSERNWSAREWLGRACSQHRHRLTSPRSTPQCRI